ncbi:MAG TPA: transglutaminase-like domain-containing protein, partial [Clostridia bacterium]
MVSYLLWIATTKSTSENLYFPFWVATIMFACYGFSYPVFYFAVVRFRIFFLLMIGMISFLLQSAKNQSELSVTFFIYTIMFFILYIDQWKRKNTGTIYESKGSSIWYRLSITLFMLLVIGIAFIIPKPGRIPQIAYLDAVISQAIKPLGAAVQNAAQGQSSENSFAVRLSSQRHLDSYNASLGDRVLFEVEAKEPLYLVLQSFDHYEKNNWSKRNTDLQRGHKFEYFEPRYEKLDAIWNVKNNMKVFGYKDFEPIESNILRFPSISPKRSSAVIVSRGYILMSYLTTPGVTGIETSKKKTVVMSESSQCFEMSGGIPEIYGKYTISYISQQLGPATREFNLVKRLPGGDVEKLFSDVYSNDRDKLSNEELEVLKSSIDEMNIADENYLQLPLNMPKRIYDLSRKITSGFKSDYDKANAIVAFLNGPEFSYELKQPVPPDELDYNDYFIFQSKKGICIHFASAMTLLARAAGLPAKYVEGFSATEYDSSSRKYIVREKDAHAFPEVYIKGYGWMVFEPTPSIIQSQNNSMFAFFTSVAKAFSSIISYVIELPLWIKIMFIPYILFVFFFMVWAFLKIRKKAWKNYLKRSDR